AQVAARGLRSLVLAVPRDELREVGALRRLAADLLRFLAGARDVRVAHGNADQDVARVDLDHGPALGVEAVALPDLERVTIEHLEQVITERAADRGAEDPGPQRVGGVLDRWVELPAHE